MQLTTQRLKQIIKEELEAIVAEMGDEVETELSPEEQEVASLEQQLAEAKKKAEMGKKAAMKGKEKPQGTRNMNVGKRPPAASAGSKKSLGAKQESHRYKPLKGK
jgi:hypothetical protein